jgi:hypothetical protein
VKFWVEIVERRDGRVPQQQALELAQARLDRTPPGQTRLASIDNVVQAQTIRHRADTEMLWSRNI